MFEALHEVEEEPEESDDDRKKRVIIMLDTCTLWLLKGREIVVFTVIAREMKPFLYINSCSSR